MHELSDIRTKIDAIDEQIVSLVKQRLALANEVADFKRSCGKPVFDPLREEQLLNRLAELAGDKDAADIRKLYATLLSISKGRQYARLGMSVEETSCKQPKTDNKLGSFLKLEVKGASHAPQISMQLEHFPKGFQLDMEELNSFLQRRAPGRDNLSSQRQEKDVPHFTAGLKNGITTGEPIAAHIFNTDAHPADYKNISSTPRPGHADYTQWIQTGRIPSGGGRHSGRMTAPLCIAGGICLQWLNKRGISIQGSLLSAGGNSSSPDEAIKTALQEGDSVGGIIEIEVRGLQPGLGGALYHGLECALTSAIFTIPGVKGIEFGGGFALASMRGSQANDIFFIDDGKIAIQGNNHGGLLGGITTGMPLIMRLAMKPTPSIRKPQQSVDLIHKCNTQITVEGRHDPCIAKRAVPVAEAMTAFALTDAMLADEASRPRICLTLSEATLTQDLAAIKQNSPFIDMCELRVDCLNEEQQSRASEFPRMAAIPVILTIRRTQDGGKWTLSEHRRIELFRHLLQSKAMPFAYVDFEDDFRYPELESAAKARGIQIIRSLHDFSAPITDIPLRARQIKGISDDIPKLAFAVNHCSDVERLFRETENFNDFPHIICAMGTLGQLSRILASRTHSMLTFTSPHHATPEMKALGHLTPETLVHLYGFRNLTQQTELYAVTGWPLGHSLSPELNNSAFFNEAQNAVMVPIPAESAAEALHCAEALHIKGMAVTIPHKTEMLSLISSISDEAAAVGAVNTIIRQENGWYGANTDIVGFRKTLLDFLGVSSLEGWQVAILGAGGAANAVAYVIAQLKGDACIFNRTLEKARCLADKYGFKAASLGKESLELLQEHRRLIIQATSVGLSSRTDLGDTLEPIPFYDFHGDEHLYDLIYSPAETPLMIRAKAAGCPVKNGLSMLMEQAAEQRRLYKNCRSLQNR